jgi:tetratricopeptide (TPR) repeat protein
MLETIREYALERLRGHADERAIQDQHAAYFRRFVERCGQRLHGDELFAALNELDRDYNNIRAALHWLYTSGQYEAMAHVVSALHEYWDTRGLLKESHAWTTQALGVGEALPAPLRATLRSQASFLAARQGQGNEAAQLAERVLCDPQAAPEDIVRAANVAGLVGMNGGDSAGARKHFQQALAVAQQHALLRDLSTVQFNLGVLYLTTGQLTDAETLIQASSEGAQHPRFWGILSLARGFIALLRGSAPPARVAKLLREGFQQHGLVRNPFFSVYGLLACTSLVAQQQPTIAVALFGAALHQADNRDLVISPMILALFEPAIERARGAITADAYDQARRHGRSLSLDGAIALAQSLLSSMGEEEAREAP